MVNPNRSPASVLLLESGEMSADGAGAAARGVVLSRALCRFRLFQANPSLSRGQRARAARVFADANAPFADTGLLLLATPTGAAIWYWDKARLSELGFGAARQVTPESVWRTAGDGWRMLACLEGFEAQYWEGGALRASNWRRTPHTPDQWRGFVLSVDGATQRAPEEPPTPMMTDLSDSSWRRAEIRRPLGWRDLETGAWTGTLCFGAVAVFLMGQTLRFNHETRQDERRIAEVESRVSADEDVERSRAFMRLMSDFRQATSGGGALEAMAEAVGTLDEFGVQPSQLSFDAEQFSMLIGASPDRPVRDVVNALERSAKLCRVSPEIAADGISLSGGVERDGVCTVSESEPGA